MAQQGGWVSLGAAASHLGMSYEALRKMLERRSRVVAGTVEAAFDGVRARRLGKIWRVHLSAAWLEPGSDPVRPAAGRGSARGPRRASGSGGTDDGREDGTAAG